MFKQKLRVIFENTQLKKNREAIFITCLIVFPIIMRLVPPTIIALLALGIFMVFLFNHFEEYINKIAKEENKNIESTEYSWGFVKQEVDNLNFKNFINFAKSQNFDFYKNYFRTHLEYFILVFFVIGDLVLAFKNLSLSEAGVYVSLSVFCKFVFIAYLYINKNFNEILKENISDEVKQIRILDGFYKHFNGLASISFVLFILFFILSKFISEIFFGADYTSIQTSLPFVLLANLFLVISMMIFRTSILVDKKATYGILKIYIPLFAILFIFMSINYYDTIAYFVMGSSAVLSIFLYNFSIRKPAYIESTYNFLF